MSNKLKFVEYGYQYNQPFYGKMVFKVYIDNIFHGFVVVKYKDNPDHQDYIKNVYQPMSKEERNAVKHYDVPPRKIFDCYEVYSNYSLLCGNNKSHFERISNDAEMIEFLLKENG